MIAWLRTFLAIAASLIGLLLVLPIIVLAVPFWVVASLTRWVNHLLEPQVVSWQQLMEFHPGLGWKPKEHLDTHCVPELGGDGFRVVTGPQGWPGRSSIAESKIVVFGDSFAFGYGVNAGSSFSQLDPNLGVKAIGAPGYNMVQELLLMQQYASQLNGKLVVWFVYYGNDLWENLQPNMQNYRTPFVRKENGSGQWEIVTSHLQKTKWWPYRPVDPLRSQERLQGVFGNTLLTDRIYSACEYLIQQGSDVCSQAGAPLAVLTIPTLRQLNPESWDLGAPQRWDYDIPDRKIAAICSELDVRFVAGKDYLVEADYIPAEGHWNQKGHQQIVKVLRRLYYDAQPGNGTAAKSSKTSAVSRHHKLTPYLPGYSD